MLLGGSATLAENASLGPIHVDRVERQDRRTFSALGIFITPNPQIHHFNDFNPWSIMAGDTQEPMPHRPKDAKPQRADSHGGTMPPVAPSNANALPGGGQNTAGSKNQEASLLDAAKTIRLSEFKEIHKKPCVRDALMTGIGVGFGIGGVRSILGGKCSSYLAVNKTCLRECSLRDGLVQLGSRLVLLRFLFDVRILPAQASPGIAWDEASR